MKEFNRDVEKISHTIGEVKEQNLSLEIYKKFIEDLGSYIKADSFESEYKMKTLDMFAQDSFVNDCKPTWMDYKSMASISSYQRNGDDVGIDIVGDPNNIPTPQNVWDIIFVIGSKFGYGQTHNAIPSVEGVIKSGGLLIVALSRYWYHREFLQLLLGYRAWDYIRSCEVLYKIIEKKIDSAKYFCYFRYKG